MTNETDITKLTSKVEELLGTNQDNSWSRWSQYTIKAIEGLSEDIKDINVSRETILINLAELKSSVIRVENAIHDFTDFKEKIIAPLRIKVAVLAIISGFFGGVFAACIPVMLKYLLGQSPA